MSKTGKIKECAICGKQFVAIVASQKYCGEACRQQGKAIVLEKAKKARKAESQNKSKKKKMSELARINEMARDAGFNYGAYVALHKL